MSGGARTVAIVQARLGSSRLPAKVLLDLCGRTALERCLSRVRRVPGVDEVVVATSEATADDVIALAARRLGYPVCRGSEHDVLSRYAKAAREHRAEIVLRFTSDCPLLDPAVSVLPLGLLSRGGFDYASNTLTRRLPRGLDTEVMLASALARADRDAADAAEREHVTMHLYRNRDVFRCGEAVPEGLPDLSSYRWTLDTLDDYRFLFSVFEALGVHAEEASMRDVLDLLSRHPELASINAHVAQKTT